MNQKKECGDICVPSSPEYEYGGPTTTPMPNPEDAPNVPPSTPQNPVDNTETLPDQSGELNIPQVYENRQEIRKVGHWHRTWGEPKGMNRGDFGKLVEAVKKANGLKGNDNMITQPVVWKLPFRLVSHLGVSM